MLHGFCLLMEFKLLQFEKQGERKQNLKSKNRHKLIRNSMPENVRQLKYFISFNSQNSAELII